MFHKYMTFIDLDAAALVKGVSIKSGKKKTAEARESFGAPSGAAGDADGRMPTPPRKTPNSSVVFSGGGSASKRSRIEQPSLLRAAGGNRPVERPIFASPLRVLSRDEAAVRDAICTAVDLIKAAPGSTLKVMSASVEDSAWSSTRPDTSSLLSLRPGAGAGVGAGPGAGTSSVSLVNFTADTLVPALEKVTALRPALAGLAAAAAAAAVPTSASGETESSALKRAVYDALTLAEAAFKKVSMSGGGGGKAVKAKGKGGASYDAPKATAPRRPLETRREQSAVDPALWPDIAVAVVASVAANLKTSDAIADAFLKSQAAAQSSAPPPARRQVKALIDEISARSGGARSTLYLKQEYEVWASEDKDAARAAVAECVAEKPFLVSLKLAVKADAAETANGAAEEPSAEE